MTHISIRQAHCRVLSCPDVEGSPAVDVGSTQTPNQTLISPPSCGSDADAGNTFSEKLLNRLHVLEVSPLPKAKERTAPTSGRAKGKTVILTSSPVSYTHLTLPTIYSV